MRYDFTLQHNGKTSEILSFSTFERMMTRFMESFYENIDSPKNWSMTLTDQRGSFTDGRNKAMITFEKTCDGFLVEVFTFGSQAYGNFPLGNNISWIYCFGEDEKPCYYWGGGEGTYYLPQKFYIPFEESEKLVKQLLQNGMESFSYHPDYWKDITCEWKWLDEASVEVRRQVFGEKYALLYGEDDEDDSP